MFELEDNPVILYLFLKAIPLYLSEMAPTQFRGALNMMFQVATTFGIFTANMINYGTQQIQPWGWRLALGLAAIPTLLMTVGGIFIPETPNSLVERGSKEQGRKLLEKMRGTDEVDAEFQDMLDAGELANSIKHPYWNILKKRYRPELVMAICMPAFQILTGINSILFYAPNAISKHGIWQSGVSLLLSLDWSSSRLINIHFYCNSR